MVVHLHFFTYQPGQQLPPDGKTERDMTNKAKKKQQRELLVTCFPTGDLEVVPLRLQAHESVHFTSAAVVMLLHKLLRSALLAHSYAAWE